MALKPKDLKNLTEPEKKICDELEAKIDQQLIERYPGYGRFDIDWSYGRMGRIYDEIRRRYGGSGGWDVSVLNEKGAQKLVLLPQSERATYSGNHWD